MNQNTIYHLNFLGGIFETGPYQLCYQYKGEKQFVVSSNCLLQSFTINVGKGFNQLILQFVGHWGL